VGCPTAVQPASQLAGTPGKGIVRPAAADKFDISQAEAFKAMTTGEFSIIQGPPGTGKTFTSVVAIESFVKTLKNCQRSRPAPIIIAAQTNHALDQLLEECVCLKLGKVIRLGGQSRSEIIKPLALYNVRSHSKFRKPDSMGQAAWKQTCGAIEEYFDVYSRDLVCAYELHDAGCITDEQYQSLIDNETDYYDDGEEHPDNSIFTWLDLGSYDSQHEIAVHTGMDVDEMEQPLLEKYNDIGDWDLDDAYEARTGRAPDDAKFRFRGLFLPIGPQHTMAPLPDTSHSRSSGSWRDQAQEILETHPNLHDVHKSHRHMVYYYLKTLIRKHAITRILELLPFYKEVCESLKVTRLTNSLEIIQQEGFEIVGCTTTGLAKYRGLLAAMMPRIMLIEEAAETKEANLAAAMFPSLERLVLVGDHQQLPPHVDIHGLEGEPYNLSVSMFERLVKLGIPHTTLQMQRRMVPRLCEVVQTFYPSLKNHPTVWDPNKRPPVPGMGGKSLWWFQHGWPESQSESSPSYSNSQEAKMIINFVKYLVASGLRASAVTILTYYNGQLELIKKMISKDAMLQKHQQHLSAYTIDGFQGKENEVILLSLVRSPDSSRGYSAAAGFVQNENRAVVATSRARRGMYVFGNARNILESSHRSKETWQKVFNAFGSQTGSYLPVTCTRHSEIINVATIKDWANISNGGCKRPCDGACPRGHPCKKGCHDEDEQHDCQIHCSAKAFCGHPCVKMCTQVCQCARKCYGPGRHDNGENNNNNNSRAAEGPKVSPYRLSATASFLKKPTIQRLLDQRRNIVAAGDKEGSQRVLGTKKLYLDYTSDEILRVGYRKFMAGEASSGAPQTLADKWSPAVVERREREITTPTVVEEDLIDFGSDN
jgi:helicase required for RNAi-mediated heterochromatin assembly 1